MKIPFNLPYLSGRERSYVLESLKSRAHCGNREFSQKCIKLMKEKYKFGEVFLTTSCTTAMEMGALLANINPGDEVILPSYTFSSTANAIVLRGAKPVFCEVEEDTMNIDVDQIERLITAKTKMIIPIDYAGIPCNIGRIMKIARENKLIVMLDAAQSLHSFIDGKSTGVTPDLVAYSFHETKNISCGEGGALVVNRPEWIERAHFLQEKGTDRKFVLDGVKSKYHWVDVGSSFLLSDILAAMLLAQLEDAKKIEKRRSQITKAYRKLFAPYEKLGFLKIPHPPDNVEINHHAFFVIFDTPANRKKFIALLKKKDIYVYIGYVPLHSSPMGRKFGYKKSSLQLTEDLASRLVRMPFYADLKGVKLSYTLGEMKKVLDLIYGS